MIISNSNHCFEVSKKEFEDLCFMDFNFQWSEKYLAFLCSDSCYDHAVAMVKEWRAELQSKPKE